MLATAGATNATAPAASGPRIPAFATVARDTAHTARELERVLGENVITDARGRVPACASCHRDHARDRTGRREEGRDPALADAHDQGRRRAAIHRT